MDDIAAERGLDPADVRRRNLVTADAFPHATPSGGHLRQRRLPPRARAGARRTSTTSGSQGAGRRPRERRVDGHRAWPPSSTRPRRTSGTSAWPPRSQDRTAKRGKSGSTEHVRVSVDLQGVVSVLLGTVPQGQGHATVARDIVARHLGLPVGAGAAARRDGHRQHALDDQLRQLLLPVRAAADQRPAGGRGPDRGDHQGRGRSPAGGRPGLPGAGRRHGARHRRPRALGRLPARRRARALGPGLAARRVLGPALRGGGVHPAAVQGGLPDRPDQLQPLLRVRRRGGRRTHRPGDAEAHASRTSRASTTPAPC